jgi:anti-anti-sigma regulatory factor
MPIDVRCQVEADQPYALVRLVGTLDLAAVGALRGTLLTCLADQPSTAIVDLTGLEVREPAALAVLAEVAREAAEWPGGRLVFWTLSPAAANGWGDDADVVVSTDIGAVYARMRADASIGRQLSAHLEPVVGAARRARELVTDGCARWDLPALAGAACIAVTEMVNNVVAHARTSMTVRIGLREGLLHVAVRDYSPRAPSYAGLVPPTSPGGRGLLLIDTVARRWGTSLLDDGKVVWAVLYPEDELVDNPLPA